MKFKAQNNTDTIDIYNKCLGISVWVDGDSTNQLNTNRGLHTQIRHNGDKETYEAAVKLQKLLTAAPKMLNFLNNLYIEMSQDDNRDEQVYSELIELINKAK